jgi:biotin carboxylase
MRRVLLLATTTGYQVRMFSAAAAELGIELIYATDRCDQLDDPWQDRAIAVRFHEEGRSLDTLLMALAGQPVSGVLAVGDRPTVLAAHVTNHLGLPGHSVAAATTTRDKRLAREQFRRAGLRAAPAFAVPVSADPLDVLPRVTFPAVLKPTILSASRGVIRADDEISFASAFERVRRLLASADVQDLRDPESDVIQIEQYIPGVEFALEGVLERGALRTLAIFDKPDPLEGPFFEETIYVTPSRASADMQAGIVRTVEQAVRVLGLYHGPIHAECRVHDAGVFVLEVAARPIGGLCAKALRFERGGRQIGLEHLLLLHAAGEPLDGWQREPRAAGVMMIPIPKSGVLRGVAGVDDAGRVPGIDDIQITARPDQKLLALPEGASYLGFIFARAATAREVDQALRDAHATLRVTLDPILPVTGG